MNYLMMSYTETISEIFTRFVDIIDSQKTLGRDIPKRVGRQVIKFTSKKLETKGDCNSGGKRFNYTKT